MNELIETSELYKPITICVIGKECYYLDKVTFDKKFQGRPLGICVGETINKVNNLTLCWFEKPFLGFKWIYKSDVSL